MNIFNRTDINKFITNQDVPGLNRCLKSNDPQIQFQAAEALIHLGQTEGYNFLYNCLGHTNISICCAAIELLGELKDPGAVKYLIPLLADSNSEVRETAIEGLSQINSYESIQAVQEYRQKEDEETKIRKDKKRELDESQFMPLSDPILGVTAIQDLEPEVGTLTCNRPAAEQLFVMADHHQEDGATMQAYNECLKAISLCDDWADLYNLKGIILEDLDKPYLAILAYQRAVKLDAELSASFENLKELQQDLSIFGETLDFWVEQASSGDWQSRCNALAALNQYPDPEAVNVIAKFLHDDDTEVSNVAMDALLASALPLAEEVLQAYYNEMNAAESDSE